MRHTGLIFLMALMLSLSCFAEPLKSIRFGTTVSLQGKYSVPSRMIRNAYRLWEMETNRLGGLMGRPVSIIMYNDKSDPELAK